VALYSLIALSVLNHSALTGSRVAVTLYAIDLQASPFTVGTLMALYGLLPMLFSVSAGRLSDRIAARWPMLVGSIMVGAGTLLPFLVPGIATLYATSILVGSGIMAFQVPVQSVTGMIGKPEDRPTNFSLLGLGYSSAMLLGPVVAGFAIDGIGHLNAFMILSLLPLPPMIVLALGRIVLPRAHARAAGLAKGRVVDLLQHRELRRLLITNALLALSWDLFMFMMPIYGRRIGLSASVIGVIIGSLAVATFTIRSAMPFLLRRLPAERLIRIALVIIAAAFLLIPLVTNVAVLMGLAFLLGIGLGSAQPMVMALMHNAAPEGRSGEAVGLRFTVIYISQTVMPMVYGALGTALGIVPVFWIVAIAMAAGSRVSKERPNS